MIGGQIIAGATLSRFFALHVFVIPGLLIMFVGVQLLMVLKLGINEWPMPGRIVRRATYMQEYRELTHKQGIPFVPSAVWKDILFSGFTLLAIAACAVYFGPFGPGGQPDPTIIQTAPRPDFFFLCLGGWRQEREESIEPQKKEVGTWGGLNNGRVWLAAWAKGAEIHCAHSDRYQDETREQYVLPHRIGHERHTLLMRQLAIFLE